MTDLIERHKRLCEYHMVDECPDDDQDDVGWIQFREVLDDLGAAAQALRDKDDEIARLTKQREDARDYGCILQRMIARHCRNIRIGPYLASKSPHLASTLNAHFDEIAQLKAKTEIDAITMDNFLRRIESLEVDNTRLRARVEELESFIEAEGRCLLVPEKGQ